MIRAILWKYNIAEDQEPRRHRNVPPNRAGRKSIQQCLEITLPEHAAAMVG